MLGIYVHMYFVYVHYSNYSIMQLIIVTDTCSTLNLTVTLL